MEQTNTSILSRFLEYGFKSTSVYNKRAVGRKWLLALFVFLTIYCGFALSAGIVALVVYVFLGFSDREAENICGSASLILWLVVFVPLFLMLIITWYKKSISTSSFADYIQTKGKMRFFVKDGKFGLVKWNNFKIFIPAMYDKLMWVQENEVMKAYVNGEEFLIDIHNNKLS